MNRLVRLLLGGTVIALACWASGCSHAPGAPPPHAAVGRPDQELDFAALYASNCAGCHGPDGRGGAALPLHNPAYLAVAGAANLRSAISRGLPSTLMPPFARSAGGMLTDQQVDALVAGMLRQWSEADEFAGVALPPYAAAAPGNPEQGRSAYEAACARCHGTDGGGAHPAPGEPEPPASSPYPILDPSYLALVSDQSLRSIVIAGHPGDRAPDWRSYVAGRALAPQEITDIVAWLGSHRAAADPRSPAAGRTAAPGGAKKENP